VNGLVCTQALLGRPDFSFVFDGLHGVAGPYAQRIFVQVSSDHCLCYDCMATVAPTLHRAFRCDTEPAQLVAMSRATNCCFQPKFGREKGIWDCAGAGRQTRGAAKL